jgi:hypothetical protein
VGAVTATELPVVVRDVFPAGVLYDGQVYRSARAVITRDRVLVYLRPGDPVLDLPYDPAASVVPPLNAPRSRAAHLAVRAADGTLTAPALHVNGQRGCGCNNPLKGWTPWQPYRKAST